jgi:formate hydrogenlyase subunit 3/multisubunit Na+/H+ antiporter MnhD subunit
MPMILLLSGIAALLILAVVALFLSRRSAANAVVYGGGLLLSLGLLGVGVQHLLCHASPRELSLPLGLPWIGAHFRLDALSAFFVVIVNLGAAVSCLYALGYGQHAEDPSRVRPFVPAFVAGMNLVLLAADAFTFLLSWEVMSLASWALVVAEHRDPRSLRAGYIYALMASLGTFALLLAFGLLAGPNGSYAFAAMRAAQVTPAVGALVLCLVVLGAGSKAGLVPLHVWLPEAHPAAPSHVSALMSGVMTKVAVYAVIRIVFDLLGPPHWWWGIVLLALGGASALMGILYALFESDQKRVLAFSTIENIGFIFVALGLALAFRADGFQAAAALALTAALFHVFNHSILKGLLFFGAGAVQHATGTRDMERLGGLIHRMSVTAVAVLIGCVGIAALPPLNAFASEWLIFQAILLSPSLPQWGLKLLVPAVGALLALAVTLAAACFVRFFGMSFLGRPRSEAASSAEETDVFSRAAMLFLAGFAVLAGLLPGVLIDALGPVSASLVGRQMPLQTSQPWLSIVPIAASRSSYNGLLVFIFIAMSAGIVASTIHIFASRRVRRAPAWNCGFADTSPLLQYSASSFSEPIRRVFGPLLFLARTEVEIPPPGNMGPARLRVHLEDVIWQRLYVPVTGLVASIADRLNVFQFLTIRRYLSLVFLALVSLLLVLAIWS